MKMKGDVDDLRSLQSHDVVAEPSFHLDTTKRIIGSIELDMHLLYYKRDGHVDG